MDGIKTLTTDILIIGSGLAGLRAGIAALETGAGKEVTIVTSGNGPSGSSFTNINNALGIQVCLTDDEKKRFVNEAVTIARPGTVDKELVSILAEESEKSFRFLKEFNIDFDRNDRGKFERYHGCFSPVEKRAFIFRNLANVFRQLKNVFTSHSGKLIENHSAVKLIKDNGRVKGAVFFNDKKQRVVCVFAGNTIVAAGGTTPLFQWNVCGKDVSGHSLALLKEAGVSIINEPFYQFLWHDTRTLRPVFPFHDLRQGGKVLVNNSECLLSESFLQIIPERGTHVPVAYSFNDTVLDRYLYECADRNGVVSLISPEKKICSIALFAHAWNGGAKIDKNGWTGVPGLYTCGECAGGMHGSNRLGGAMVLSTQVYGKRAGEHAVKTLSPLDLVGIKNVKAYINGEASSLVQLDSAEKKKIYRGALEHLFYPKSITEFCCLYCLKPCDLRTCSTIKEPDASSDGRGRITNTSSEERPQ
jgi:L-aspartate oxidase